MIIGLYYQQNYGLLRQQDVIEPYDLTLNMMKVSEQKEWSRLVRTIIVRLIIKSIRKNKDRQ